MGGEGVWGGIFLITKNKKKLIHGEKEKGPLTNLPGLYVYRLSVLVSRQFEPSVRPSVQKSKVFFFLLQRKVLKSEV